MDFLHMKSIVRKYLVCKKKLRDGLSCENFTLGNKEGMFHFKCNFVDLGFFRVFLIGNPKPTIFEVGSLSKSLRVLSPSPILNIPPFVVVLGKKKSHICFIDHQ